MDGWHSSGPEEDLILGHITRAPHRRHQAFTASHTAIPPVNPKATFHHTITPLTATSQKKNRSSKSYTPRERERERRQLKERRKGGKKMGKEKSNTIKRERDTRNRSSYCLCQGPPILGCHYRGEWLPFVHPDMGVEEGCGGPLGEGIYPANP